MNKTTKSLSAALQEAIPSLLPMHMPGHKRNPAFFPYLSGMERLDITEITGFSALMHPSGPVKDALDFASEFYGAKATFFLVNGSTVGNLSAIHCMLNPGEEALVARNCHLSVFHALSLKNIGVSFVEPDFDEDFHVIGSLRPEAVEQALTANPAIRLVVVTSPTYEGVISDIRGIAEAAHRHGARLLVDEAHGAHLDLSPYFTGGAVRGGADIVVQSLHKTLPALTQTAVAHVMDESLIVPFREALSVFQSTSPSFLFLAAIDGCVRFLQKNGAEHFRRWHDALKIIQTGASSLKTLRLLCYGGDCLSRHSFHGFDPSKLLIHTNGSIDGKRLMQDLRQTYRIECEYATCTAALAMTGMGDTAESMNRLLFALMDMDKKLGPKKPQPDLHLPALDMALTPFEAQGAFEAIPLRDAVGRIAAEYLYCYPPGVPMLIPGALITDESVGCILESLKDGLVVRKTRSVESGAIAVLRPGDPAAPLAFT